MDQKMKQEPKRRAIGLTGIRARASQHTDTALAALKDVAASAEADPQARVEAAKEIVDYAMIGK